MNLSIKESQVSIFNIQGEQIMEYQYQNFDIIKFDESETIQRNIFYKNENEKKNYCKEIYKTIIAQDSKLIT